MPVDGRRWAARSEGRNLQPRDGFIEVPGGRFDCEQLTAFLKVPAGATLDGFIDD